MGVGWGKSGSEAPPTDLGGVCLQFRFITPYPIKLLIVFIHMEGSINPLFKSLDELQPPKSFGCALN